MQTFLTTIGKFLINEGRFIIGLGVLVYVIYAWETISNSEDFLRWVICIQPNNAKAHLGLGNHLKSDEPEEAEKEIRQAIALNPRLRDAYYSLYSFLFDKKERIEDLQKIVVQMLQTLPNDGITYVYQAGVLSLQGSYTDAENTFLKAIKMLPASSFVYGKYGDFLLAQKRLEEAEKVFRKAIA